jgi:aminopeptidase N
MRSWPLCACALLWPLASGAAQEPTPRTFTHADTLRGADTPQRAWWDVSFYDLHVAVHPADSTIAGYNGITYRVLRPAREMQIDLQVPLIVDSMVQDGRRLSFRRDGNAFFATLATPQRAGDRRTITVYYHGKPRAAVRPPWDGGLIWAQDSAGNAWVATANEGLGASVWWPNKDYLADEPDSQRVAITMPDPMFDVSNGRLRGVTPHPDSTTTYEWFVMRPINNYDIAINAGGYAHFSTIYAGEAGPLTMDFWPLAYHREAAERQFTQAQSMMKCFESWFGPYPWYEDGYKLVETPHLGMEHQTAVAYGNHYGNGYLGRDLSHTGLGLLWDFIVVHESAHEWFGNNITMQDQADMWVHEGFANYSENLYTECLAGKQAGAQYVIGTRQNIRNDRPIVGQYGVNDQGSGDMYYKGGNMLHTIRQIIGDDAKWRGILRGLNRTFRHQTVTGQQVQDYISREAGVDLRKVFEQYLTTTHVPVFEYSIVDSTLAYRWTDVIAGFDMPVKATVTDSGFTMLRPTDAWQRTFIHLKDPVTFHLDQNFYVLTRHDVAPPPQTGR